MWKALIKLVEKWSYRCPHDWELIKEMRSMDRRYKKGDLPEKVIMHYRCKKCCEFKSKKL